MQEPKVGRPPVSRRPRFGLRSLLLFMLVASVMGAAGYHFVQGMRQGRASLAVFILFTLIAPLLLAFLLSNLRYLLWFRRRR
jgi:hypothetical protein